MKPLTRVLSGFLVPCVLADSAADVTSFVDLVNEVVSARDTGSQEAMAAIKAKHSGEEARKNYSVVVDFRLRWLGIRRAIATCMPDVIAMQVRLASHQTISTQIHAH